MDRRSGALRGATAGLLAGVVLGGLEVLRLHLGPSGPALHVLPAAVLLDGVLGASLGALVGLVVGGALPRPAVPGALAGALIAAAVGAGVGPWAAPPAPEQPHPVRSTTRPILLIAVDGLAPADLEAMPRLGALAADAVLFDDAWAPSPEPRALLATLLTGRLAPGHGADTAPLAPDVPSLGRAVRREGVPGAAWLHRDLDLADGLAAVPELAPRTALGLAPPVHALLAWPLVHALLGPGGREAAYATAPALTAEARAFIEAHAGAPWVAVVHLADPLQEGFDHAEGLALVDAAVADLVGAATAASPDVLWSVVGTIGPPRPGPASLRMQVPWVAGGTSVSPRRVPDVVSTADVVPSLLVEAGYDAVEVFDGAAHFHVLGRHPPDPRLALPPTDAAQRCQFAYGEPGRRPVVSVDPTTGRTLARNDGYVVHLRDGRTWALFDRVADPLEEHDLLGGEQMTCFDIPATDRAATLAEAAQAQLDASRDQRDRALPPPRASGGRRLLPEAPPL